MPANFAMILFTILLIATAAYLIRGEERCGPNYSNAFSMCCRGVVVRKSGLDPRCCGKSGDDAKWSICCEGTVSSTGGMLEPACCGRQPYDRKFRVCCPNKQIQTAMAWCR